MTRSTLVRVAHTHVLAMMLVATALPASAASRQRDAAGHKEVTRASWYGKDFGGRRTASGSLFNPSGLTAAHRTLNMGSKVKVTELRSGKSVVVQITDRGPYAADRGIDLSYAAARQLGIVRRGVARVRIELLGHERPMPPVVMLASYRSASPWLPKALIE